MDKLNPLYWAEYPTWRMPADDLRLHANGQVLAKSWIVRPMVMSRLTMTDPDVALSDSGEQVVKSRMTKPVSLTGEQHDFLQEPLGWAPLKIPATSATNQPMG